MLRRLSAISVFVGLLAITAPASWGQYYSSWNSSYNVSPSYSYSYPAAYPSTYGNTNTGTIYSQPAYSYGYQHQGHYSYPTYPAPSYRSQSSPSYMGNVHNYSSHPTTNRIASRRTYSSHQILGRFRDLNTAHAGRYTVWRTAPGTSRSGYLAVDGSRWTLMKSDGIVQIDSQGKQQKTADQASSIMVWKIERSRDPSRSAWIARDEATGTVSVLYQRPDPSSGARFFPATVTLDGARITDITWRIKPDWANTVSIAKGNQMPRLPIGSFRSTTRPYITATQTDLVAAKQAFQQTIAKAPSRSYDDARRPASIPVIDQKPSSLSLTVSE